MTEKKRECITPELLSKMGDELVEMHIVAEKAVLYAGIFETILEQTKALRTLPIKDVEPALVFSAVPKETE